MQATSRAAERGRSERGFALYELVLALAIMGLVATIVVPRLARPPGPVEIGNAAEEIAALLRTDRNAAISGRHAVISEVDVAHAIVRSGATGRTLKIPRGVAIEVVQSSRELDEGHSGFRFLADGRSSGGALTLRRGALAYRVSVNWLTAAVRIARVEAGG